MGLVSDLGEELITNSNNLMTEEERDILANRLNAVRVPYDLGRLPRQDDNTRVESATVEEFHCNLCKGLFMECSTKQTL